MPTLSKDWHVIAAAIHAQAKYIVTFDLKHFPKTVLQSHNIEAVSPDEFVQRLIKERRISRELRCERAMLIVVFADTITRERQRFGLRGRAMLV
jgi:hypothetical protein